MASRPVFVAAPGKRDFVEALNVEFEWYPGFAVVQKQKSIASLHENFRANHDDAEILEISSKSTNELGVALSAFNLMIETKNGKSFSVETAFQSSKVFERGGPYVDLLTKTSKEAKKDPRIKTSGNLLSFKYFSREWPIEPKTLFYDWLYINALARHASLEDAILEYSAFSDIEFNPDKSINCQAKSAALYVSLHRNGLLQTVLASEESYIELMTKAHEPRRVNSNENIGTQMRLFTD